MKTQAQTQLGSTLIELVISFGILGGLVLSVCSALTYLQTQTQQVNLRVSREHAVMSFLDQIRNNLSSYQANYNPCSDYASCGTASASNPATLINCNQPLAAASDGGTGNTTTSGNATSGNANLASSIMYWGNNGLCAQADGCPGMMQVNIQPFGSNIPSQRGFFVVNITVCHQMLGGGAPFQYEYLVTSQ